MIYLLNSISFDFSAVDDYAWTIFITGYVIVFTALISLSLLFKYLPLVLNIKRKPKVKNELVKEVDNNKNDDDSNDDAYAAIAMAVNLYLNDMHDEESLILTIDRDNALNSPWGSKIHNINTL